MNLKRIVGDELNSHDLAQDSLMLDESKVLNMRNPPKTSRIKHKKKSGSVFISKKINESVGLLSKTHFGML